MKWIGLIAGKSGDALTDEIHNKGYKVALISGQTNEPGWEKADHNLITDLENKSEIKSFFEDRDIKLIIIGTGHWKAIALAEYLELNGFITSIDTIKSKFAKNKTSFKNELIKVDIDTPKFIISKNRIDNETVQQQLGIPCVIKSPIDLVQPIKANSIFELEEAIQKVLDAGSELLIEEYIKGVEYTVPVRSDGSNIQALGVLNYHKANEYNLQGFDKTKNERLGTLLEKRLEIVAVDIVRKFNFTGLVRVDFIVTDHRIMVLELNSIIITGYTSTLMPFYKEAGVEIGKEMIEVSLDILKKKLANKE